MRQGFTIQGRLAGLNDYVDAAHTYWKRTKLKQEQQAVVMEAAKGMRPMDAPVEVDITYYEGRTKPRQRVRDLDNVIGGGNKFILDALVEMGVLSGDDPQTVTRITARGFASTNPRITVQLRNGD